MNTHIVTAVDTSDSADGKARVLKLCKTREEAVAYVKQDMEAFVADANGMNLNVDYDAMSAQTSDGNYGCEWNIEEVEIPSWLN